MLNLAEGQPIPEVQSLCAEQQLTRGGRLCETCRETILREVIARHHGVGVSLASVLLDAGARTYVRDAFLKSTPLGWACRWGRVELVTLLLARGADPIEAGAEPWATPLAWAERRQHAGIASILRQHGSDR